MIVAIIPARGGSKRIPRKNVREFCGRPMIAWPIETAIRSKLFDRIIVSTDDPEIMKVATAAGAEAPFTRPTQLSDDHTPTVPVVRHSVNWLEDSGCPVKMACCIYPTAPFLQSDYLTEGLNTLRASTNTEFAFSVTSFEFPIFRAVKLDPDNRISMFWPEHELTRSQDLPPAYHDAGQFYWGTAEAWQTRDRIFSSRAHGIVLPSHLVQDIDTLEDWKRAELMMEVMRNE
jgi:N-acylneuraminate cytidylyltransferase